MRTDPDVEALRQRLYRPGASEHDLTAYLCAADAEGGADGAETTAARPAAPPSAERSRSPRPFVIGAVTVLAVAALGGATLLGGRATPTRTPTPTPTPTEAVATGTSGSNQVWFVAAGGDPVLDGGEQDHARGTSVSEGPDMVRYTVATGDRVGAIARRFGLCQGDVLLALPYGVDPAALPPDQTLELSRSSTSSPPGC